MAHPSNPDPFDDLLTLEDTLYASAYELGTQDGARAGRIEGRIFGLEKSFEKFTTLGALHGRAVVWGSRLPSQAPPRPTSANSKSELEHVQVDEEDEGKGVGLPALKENERLRKNIQMLHGLTDPETFSTLNTEEAVADFDDRFKRAGAKAKITERIVGETCPSSPSASEAPSAEAKGRSVKLNDEGKKKGDDSMEDFAGSRFLS